ncbi:MAG: 6,7-dimethyl-8-ribityllumazine synthase [Bacteroidia bacterium]|nr:6,7-dimethyl-8-ribityllumazine synthase [Bacteroidia bacterium]
MSTQHKNLSSTNLEIEDYFKTVSIGIVVSEWNTEITNALKEGAIAFLKQAGVQSQNIKVQFVPGSFELTLGAQWMAQLENIDAVISLGCVIQGETKHFDFICDACANGITQVGLKFNKPVVFGVLTTNTMQQAIDRSGGKYGNKGTEAAETALKMLQAKNNLFADKSNNR